MVVVDFVRVEMSINSHYTLFTCSVLMSIFAGSFTPTNFFSGWVWALFAVSSDAPCRKMLALSLFCAKLGVMPAVGSESFARPPTLLVGLGTSFARRCESCECVSACLV